jgi:membrane protease subunit HflC
MKELSKILGIIAVFVLILVLKGSLYTVKEWDQVLITQFGKPVGEPEAEAGLHFKIPFIQDVNRIEKRILEWDGDSEAMPTRDKLFIHVDTFARWRIKDPLAYYTRLRDERSAQSRLEDILGSETRNAVAKHDLIEVIRTTKDREPAPTDKVSEILSEQVGFAPIKKGRAAIEKEIFAQAEPKLLEIGIELLDVRFKRINYNSAVEGDIFKRMISERQQIAELFRSEGAGEAARILGDMERDVLTIESESYRKVQELLGAADAESTEIYANAYGKDAGTEEFYGFTKTLEAYSTVLGSDTTVIFTTKSDLFGLLKSQKSE